MKLAAMIAPLLLLAGAIGATQAALRGDAGESTALEASAEGSTLVLLQQQILASKKSHGELEAAHEHLQATHEQLTSASASDPPAAPAAGTAPGAPALDPKAEMTDADAKTLYTAWGAAIKLISSTYLAGMKMTPPHGFSATEQDKFPFVVAAGKVAGDLYGYDQPASADGTLVLFKPTKAADKPFRPTGTEAMSYFVGAANMKVGGIAEDGGFAINGGEGWSEVTFPDVKHYLNGPVAIAMGHYEFTNAGTQKKTLVEFTFGYKKFAAPTGVMEARIFLHHSSLPYVKSPG